MLCKINTFFTLTQRYDTSCPFSATKTAENVDGTGKNSGSATKTAPNVDGAGKIGGSATKRAKNVAGAGKIGCPATKMTENVAESVAVVWTGREEQ